MLIKLNGKQLEVTKRHLHLRASLPGFESHPRQIFLFKTGSGCGAVGRVVASNTRGPGFESSHRQLLLNIYLLLTVCRKDENKKEAANGPFKKYFYLKQLS